MFLLRTETQVSLPYSTTGKITLVYINV
jgi:hypothetical protein